MVFMTKYKIYSAKKIFGYYPTQEEAERVRDNISKRNPKIKNLKIDAQTANWKDGSFSVYDEEISK